MCPHFLAIGFWNIGWWALAMRYNSTSYICASSVPAFPQVMNDFDSIALLANSGNFTCSSQVKRPHTPFTCVTWSLPVKTGKYTCLYVASSARRIHAIVVKNARKLQVTSPAGCRLTYLQFAREFTRGVIPDCLHLQLILCGIAGIFACDCAGIFSSVCSYFCLRLAGTFTCDSSVFASKLHLFLPAKAGNFTC